MRINFIQGCVVYWLDIGTIEGVYLLPLFHSIILEALVVVL